MNISQEVKASTGAPVDHHDVAGGRKTVESIIEDAPVLVTMSDDDAIVFSDEVSLVPSLESESDDEEMEEESEDEEEEMDDEGKLLLLFACPELENSVRVTCTHQFLTCTDPVLTTRSHQMPSSTKA
jgi:hypothetical protein